MRSTLPALVLLSALLSAQERPIRLAQDPVFAPGGRTLYFAWEGDVWTADTASGAARRLTTHPAEDGSPRLSPDGRSLAFVSRRNGQSQVWVMPSEGGAPRQVTFDSEGKALAGFTPDGQGVVILQGTDASPFRPEGQRAFVVTLGVRKAPRELLPAGCSEVALSPDGTKALFTRGGMEWWRKGYRGARAAQLWLADLSGAKPVLKRLSQDRDGFQNVAERNPIWTPDGKGYYFASDPEGTFELYYRNLDGSGERRVTHVGADGSDDGVANASLSADGKTLVFRRLFDLYRADPATGAAQALPLRATGDETVAQIEMLSERSATAAAFTKDGKQVAFVAGDDVYVMDTVLKEPVRVTNTPQREKSLAFSPDGKRLYFTSDAGGEVDIWSAAPKSGEGAWWQAREFTLTRLTEDAAVEGRVAPSPNGKMVAFTRRGELWLMDPDGQAPRKLVSGWNEPDYDWSPDGKWLVYSAQDDDYNSDVFVVPVDGSRTPYNLSRHPDNDRSPRWSGDGKRIAFLGRRNGDESDIWYVNLTKETEEETNRDRLLKQAKEAMQPPRPAGAPAGGRRRGDGAASRPGGDGAAATAQGEGETRERPQGGSRPAEVKDVGIDFDGIHDRLHRIAIPDSMESGLVWSPDGTQLGFSMSRSALPAAAPTPTPTPTPTPAPNFPRRRGAPGTPAPAEEPTAQSGGSGFYTVTFPDKLTPAQLGSQGVSDAKWLQEGNQIVGLQRGVPASLAVSGGRVTTHSFTVNIERDWGRYRKVVFDDGWRAMRDGWYDARLNNRDWNAVRAKYREAAGECLGQREFNTLMNLMLGELNGSHLGHSGGDDPIPEVSNEGRVTPRTWQLGLRFDRSQPGKGANGAGLLVASVIPESPCAALRSQVRAGETLLAIDGKPVDRDTDLTTILNLPEAKDLELTVLDAAGAQRSVVVRPTASVDGLLYEEWVEKTRAEVERLSNGRLGYLHIRGMNEQSFQAFEEDLFHAGYGKDGLIIDVRWNGGGSTADHVLTALTQPVHAYTAARGSGPGYPHDRKVYATWSKPAVMLCNEHSFSNAEIVSHAFKSIGRGRLVGMRTAGGVISTGAAQLLDGSSVRMPFRGWYLRDTGEDMELNGALPDITLWNPLDGPDAQLEAAVKALQEDLARAKAIPQLVPASAVRGSGTVR
ncbi:MAG: PD40 domain-containing protein [Planctomycetes bacterium]|nr:PD40 domain-containing protein [Planctomycetota bacterium]